MIRRLAKPSKRKSQFLSLSIIFTMMLSFLLSGVNTSIYAATEDSSDAANLDQAADRDLELYYYEAMQEWKEAGIELGQDEIKINAADFTEKAEEANVEAGAYGDESDVLLWKNPGGWVEYEVDVATEGLYEIEVDYHPFLKEDGGSRQSIIIGAEINGAYPFREARSVELKREYRDQDAQFDENGSQIRSLVEELIGWKNDSFRDSTGASVGPLQFHLNKGKNTIRLFSLREAVAINNLIIKEPTQHETYENVKATYPSEAKSDELITIEAEDFAKKNTTSIQVQYDRDPLTTPKDMKKIKFNAIGGMSWYEGRQAVTWEFEAAEDGLYELGFRGLQNYRKNLSVFRTVYIDDEIPFEEMKDFKIDYASSWQEIMLADENDKPFEFYLEKGKHTITFEVNHEPFIPILIDIDKLSREVKAIAEELRLASGNREDTFRVWDIEKELPGLLEQLTAMQEKFAAMKEEMEEINGETSNVSQAFNSLSQDVISLLKDPNEIPNKQVRIGTLQENLENQRQELTNSPLQVDKFYLASGDTEFPRMTSNWMEKIVGTFNSLVYSFAGTNELAEQEDDELNVWMMWGRDYAEELQQLADQQFTPEHGIKVNVNLIQDKNLLILAKAAGIMPDVALGVPQDMPFEMALRGAAKDFTELPGHEEVMENYAPGVLLPFYYNGGYYGIPETSNFKVLFYRKDILGQLGLGVPDTWDDVYEMIPTLLQNQYNFFVDPKDFTYMLYQNGVDLYQKDGISSGLDESNGFAAFEEWTDLFNLRGLDLQVQSFYQQFRNGVFPIGIADFNQYMQLLVAAPEILDVWGIAPIPGHEDENGDVVRWAGGTGDGTTSIMLFNDTLEEKQDVAWDFVKWYSSTETQTEYGLNLEQFRGETFRWNSANIHAFVEMPWRPDDLAVILEQWQWIKDIANVPGGYMTMRQLEFSWNQAVLEGGNPRTELEIAVKEINRELKRKQTEFNLRDEDGNLLESLDLPVINEPWEGAKQFER